MSKTLSLGLIAILIVGSGPGLVQAVPSSANLVAHWSYDQSSGTMLTDDSGNGHTGTLSKTPTWTDGKINNSLKFDGTDSVALGNITQINGVSKLTLATWMKRAVVGGKVEIGKQTNGQDVAIEAFSDGKVYFDLSKGSYVNGTITLNDTNWHHVALVFDGTLSGNANRLKGYVDGVQKTLTFSGTVPATTSTNTTPFNIGKIASDYSNGQVDDTWLYTRALSTAEVQDLMGGAVADTAAPSEPTSLGATAASQSQIDLSWTASTDNVGVTGYRVYRNGLQVGTSATTSYQDTGLTPSTAYSYTVRAYDAATNVSGDSNTTTATTMAPAPAPTASITAIPGAVAAGGSSILNWTSTDATSCAASGAWTGSKAVSGSQAVIVNASSTYTLTCNGAGGQVATSTTVTILAACEDGLDNDGDGLTDLADPGCTAAADNNEVDPDVAAPTVGVTAPTEGANVVGNVTVSANASDNVGVAGVKFYAGATQIGPEDTTVPYSVSWNTAAVANGAVALTAVARDAAGNTTTSSVVNVNVNNAVVTQKFIAGVSANGRYFVDQTGAPILVKADAPWPLFSLMGQSDVELWAANRESHGFNAAIISIVAGPGNGGNTNGSTYDGILPFVGGNPAIPNETYWSRMDTYMTIMKNHGITVIMYPIDGWNTLAGGAFSGKSTASIYSYGQFISNRYNAASYPNVMWNVGGDYNGFNNTINAQFTNLYNGMRSTGDTRPFSVQFNNESLSTDVTSYNSMLSWNFVYTYTTTYQKVLRGYNLTGGLNPRPSMFSEGNYEGEDWYGGLPTTNETLRRQQLWSLTSGSPGEILGTSDWEFNSGWQTRLDSVWIQQASKNRAWFESLGGWNLLVPDGATGAIQIVTAGRGTKITTDQNLDVRANDYVTAAQTPDHSLTVIYVPTAVNNTDARTITMNLAQLPASYTATWVDPTDATSTQAATVDGSGNVTTPGLHSDNTRDWLLVVKAN